MQALEGASTKGAIFALDRNGCELAEGDLVRRGKFKYRVEKLVWTVSGDGLYTETVYVECKNLRSGKLCVFEDCKVTLEE